LRATPSKIWTLKPFVVSCAGRDILSLSVIRAWSADFMVPPPPCAPRLEGRQMKFEIKNRFTDEVQFTADIEFDKHIGNRTKLGIAVKLAHREGADLIGADLSEADLRGATLRGANLRETDLSMANLSETDLSMANLSETDLRGVNLRGADLRLVNLRGADLIMANLSEANLRWVNFRGADLRLANLRGANLSETDLSEASLIETDLSETDLPPLFEAKMRITPDGVFDAWKSCRKGVIVKLRIPARARRSNATGRKCRAEYVKVLSVIGAKEGISKHDQSVIYRKGETVTCDDWCEDRWEECAGGIHFFLTREEAESWCYASA